MRTEIYYFSGTGNSLFVAQELQKRIPDSTIIPIVSLLDRTTIQTGGKVIGFVFPVHALTIPIAVKRFIRKLDARSAEYLFAIATREGTLFRGFEKIDQLLKKQHKRLDAHFILEMYNNESRHEGYRVPTEEDILTLERIALDKLNQIQEIIKERRSSREKDVSYTIDFPHGPLVNYLTEKVVLAGMTVSEYIGGVNYFYQDGNCSGCGICQKVCLSEKIKMVENKPVWQKDVLCYMCFACLNYCPKKAVQVSDIPGVKSFSKINGRYTHPYATVKDIAQQKECAGTQNDLSGSA